MYTSIAQIKQANEKAQKHFFSPSALRFFRSRISSKVYAGKYFITSEQFDAQSPRLYTIRMIEDNGSVDTIGEFQQYTTWAQADRAAKKLV